MLRIVACQGDLSVRLVKALIRALKVPYVEEVRDMCKGFRLRLVRFAVRIDSNMVEEFGDRSLQVDLVPTWTCSFLKTPPASRRAVGALGGSSEGRPHFEDTEVLAPKMVPNTQSGFALPRWNLEPTFGGGTIAIERHRKLEQIGLAVHFGAGARLQSLGRCR